MTTGAASVHAPCVGRHQTTPLDPDGQCEAASASRPPTGLPNRSERRGPHWLQGRPPRGFVHAVLVLIGYGLPASRRRSAKRFAADRAFAFAKLALQQTSTGRSFEIVGGSTMREPHVPHTSSRRITRSPSKPATESRLRKPTRSGWVAGGRPPTRHAKPLVTVLDSRRPGAKNRAPGRPSAWLSSGRTPPAIPLPGRCARDIALEIRHRTPKIGRAAWRGFGV